MSLRAARTNQPPSRRTSPLASMPELLLALLAASTASQLRAQDVPPPAPPSNDSPYTLHVYTRRLEIPTIVLASPHHPLPPIDAQTFTLSLDSGPHFHPTHIRLEGDDPITLALLLDVSGDQSDLLSAFKLDLPAWVEASLKPQDHVSIFALDCSLLQTDNYLAPNQITLEHDFDVAITSPLTHGNKNHGACHSSIRLWDSINTVMQQIAQLPGRRVLLLVSDGDDGKSILKWTSLQSEATNNDITLFALTSFDPLNSMRSQPLNALIEHSGGLHFLSVPNTLPNVLANFINKLRGRYIIDFPMPANFTAGNHLIDITLRNSDAIIRPSGITVPLPDPSLANDPTTIPSNNPDAPLLGKHRPANPHQ